MPGLSGVQYAERSVLGDHGASQPVEPIVRPEHDLIDVVADVSVFQGGGEKRCAAIEDQICSGRSTDGQGASVEVDVIVFNADAEVGRQAVLKATADDPSVCSGGSRN